MTDEETLQFMEELFRLPVVAIDIYIVEKCSELNLCPKCFKELELEVVQEDRGEYFGVQCYENVGYKFCDCCCEE